MIIAGCSGATEPSTRCLAVEPGTGPAVAQVGDVTITTDQIVRRIRDQGQRAELRYQDAAQMRLFIEDQIRVELLTHAAIDRGLANDPEVVELARQVMVRRLLKTDLGQEINLDIRDEERLRRYYTKHLNEYVQPTKRRIAHIQFSPGPKGESKAQEVHQKLAKNQGDANTFGLAAKQHSRDRATRANGGDLLYLSEAELEQQFGADFARAAFSAGIPSLLPKIVRSPQGLHVVRVTAQRDPLNRSFEQTREEIRERIQRSQRSKIFDQYLSDLKQRFPVALYDEHIQSAVAALAVQE